MISKLKHLHFFNPNALPKSKSHNVLTHLKATWLLKQTFARGITRKIGVLTQHTKQLLNTCTYLNYYLSYDICAVSLRLSVCLSEKKLLNGCPYQKMLVYKVVTFLKRIKMAVLFFDFFGSDPSKMDQT